MTPVIAGMGDGESDASYEALSFTGSTALPTDSLAAASMIFLGTRRAPTPLSLSPPLFKRWLRRRAPAFDVKAILAGRILRKHPSEKSLFQQPQSGSAVL